MWCVYDNDSCDMSWILCKSSILIFCILYWIVFIIIFVCCGCWFSQCLLVFVLVVDDAVLPHRAPAHVALSMTIGAEPQSWARGFQLGDWLPASPRPSAELAPIEAVGAPIAIFTDATRLTLFPGHHSWRQGCCRVPGHNSGKHSYSIFKLRHVTVIGHFLGSSRRENTPTPGPHPHTPTHVHVASKGCEDFAIPRSRFAMIT